RDASRERVCILVHPEHGHPMRGVLPDLDAPKHLTDRVGERPSSRDDGDPATWRERGQGFDDQVEGPGFPEQSAADLHDGVHTGGFVRHEGKSSATAAAGACRAADPSVSARWTT